MSTSKQSIYSFGFLLFFVSLGMNLSSAKEGPEEAITRRHRMHIDHNTNRAQIKWVQWRGIVSGIGPYELEFRRASDGRSFRIANSTQLHRLYREKERSLEVEVSAKLIPNTYLGGEHLEVKTFQLLGEGSPEPRKRSRVIVRESGP